MFVQISSHIYPVHGAATYRRQDQPIVSGGGALPAANRNDLSRPEVIVQLLSMLSLPMCCIEHAKIKLLADKMSVAELMQLMQILNRSRSDQLTVILGTDDISVVLLVAFA